MLRGRKGAVDVNEAAECAREAVTGFGTQAFWLLDPENEVDKSQL